LFFVWLGYQGASSFVLLSALFMANLAPLFRVPLIFGPLWSLAVEEHFYLVWPLVSRAVSARSLGLLAGCIAVTQPMIRALGFLNQTEVYYYTWFRLDGLAWGACLASFLYLASDEQKTLRRAVFISWLSAFVVMALGIPFGILTRQRLIGASLLFSVAQLFFLGLLAGTLAWRDSIWTSVLRWSWLRRCGEWSYCLYLIHLMFLQGVGLLIVKNGWLVKASSGSFSFYVARAVVAFTLAFIVAKLSFRYFESPILRRKLSDAK
jgi:peptidoglycan/LPS O-acetylase OafA/YrhL